MYKATYFERRQTPFASPLPAEPDPCGVTVYEWSDELGRHACAGAMHLRTAREIHGNCEIRPVHTCALCNAEFPTIPDLDAHCYLKHNDEVRGNT